MSARSAQMKLGMFYWPGGGQHMAAWRHPEAHPDFDVDVGRIIELAKLAEQGLFDMFFMADTLSFWRGTLEAISHDAAGAWIEPLTVMATVAQHTKHIGLVATATRGNSSMVTIVSRKPTHVCRVRAVPQVATTSPTPAAKTPITSI